MENSEVCNRKWLITAICLMTSYSSSKTTWFKGKWKSINIIKKELNALNYDMKITMFEIGRNYSMLILYASTKNL